MNQMFWRRLFEMVPLLAIPVALYALFALVSGGSSGADVFTDRIDRGQIFYLSLPSGAPWAVSGGTLLIVLALVILFFELTRGVGASRFAIVHHTLAVLLSLAGLGAFLVLDSFATSTFFILTLMCWLDMVAGVIFNIASSPMGGGGGDSGGARRQDGYDDGE
jgi:hypothetical protein